MALITFIIFLYIIFIGLGNTNNQDVSSNDEYHNQSMSNRELKELKKRQAQAQADRDLDLFLLADLLEDEDE